MIMKVSPKGKILAADQAHLGEYSAAEERRR